MNRSVLSRQMFREGGEVFGLSGNLYGGSGRRPGPNFTSSGLPGAVDSITSGLDQLNGIQESLMQTNQDATSALDSQRNTLMGGGFVNFQPDLGFSLLPQTEGDSPLLALYDLGPNVDRSREVQGMKDGGAAFPDLSGDGKITRKDILMGRGVIPMEEGGNPTDPLVQQAMNLARNGTREQLAVFLRNNLENIKAAGLDQNNPFIKGIMADILSNPPIQMTPDLPPPSPENTYSGSDLDEFRRLMEEQNRRNQEQVGNMDLLQAAPMQEGGMVEPDMMAGASPAQMMAQQQPMDAPPEVVAMAENAVQGALPQVEDLLSQYASQGGGKDIEDASSFEEMMNMVRGFPASVQERRSELAELVGPEDANQTPESVLAMVQPIVGVVAVDQGIGGLAQEEMAGAAPMGGIMDVAAAAGPGGMMVEETEMMPV